MSNNRLVVCRLVSSLEPLRHPVGCTPMKSSSSDIRWAYCDAGTSAPITLHQSMTLSRCGTSTHSSGSVAGSGQGRTCLLSPVTGVISRVHEFALPWIHSLYLLSTFVLAILVAPAVSQYNTTKTVILEITNHLFSCWLIVAFVADLLQDRFFLQSRTEVSEYAALGHGNSHNRAEQVSFKILFLYTFMLHSFNCVTICGWSADISCVDFNNTYSISSADQSMIRYCSSSHSLDLFVWQILLRICLELRENFALWLIDANEILSILQTINGTVQLSVDIRFQHVKRQWSIECGRRRKFGLEIV